MPSPLTPPDLPPPSGRTTVRRLPERGAYDRAAAHAILDEGIVCHVGIAADEGPVVIPMVYVRDGDRLLIHGSTASRLMRAGRSGVDVCVTVTLLDGLVLARSAFHHAVNYRSVVVMGTATSVEDLDERAAALDAVVEGLVPGRTADARRASARELRGTLVLALPLDEFSVKVRAGGPADEEDDLSLPVWAGVVPLTTIPGAPIPDPLHPPTTPTPPYATTYTRPSSNAAG
jgi:nitroimidazol reductase NimA-like FMN-containing flavoprotein (pyridoxamine 5'-phosphate oxidase superfamily)